MTENERGLWNQEGQDYFWIDYRGLKLFVWSRPLPDSVWSVMDDGVDGWAIIGRWQFSVWRGKQELHVSAVFYVLAESAKDAAISFADDRSYCA